MLREQFKNVKDLLLNHRETVAAIAEGLLEKDELDEDEIRVIVDEHERARAEQAASQPVPLPLAHQDGESAVAVAELEMPKAGDWVTERPEDASHDDGPYSGNGHDPESSERAAFRHLPFE